MAADLKSGEVRMFASKRRIAAAVLAGLLVLFLVRPGASRLKSRLTNSISRAVGRPADIGSVHLRFLPWPGFEIENLVIYEDAAFGAEPMLRAPEVTAVVRLTSLLRGRLDVSRLELTEPSLNLVEREDGQWNWAALLERSSRIPLAPTTKAKLEPRAGFPYIEASSGRINFKTGTEKKPYALLNADFALWQESENAWGVRLKAEPLRADTNLSDTGLLRMSGTWQRAGSLRETPLQFAVEWEGGQLGQMTKLVSGSDKGWRGDVHLKATLAGTPEAMQVAADAAVQNFRRYDIGATENLPLAAHCEGKYNSTEGMARDISCLSPVGDGMLTLRGELGRPGKHIFNLLFNAENVPVSSMAQLARRAKKDLPPDLLATGILRANFSAREDSSSSHGAELRGSGEITNLRLQSSAADADLAVATIPFFLTDFSTGESGSGSHPSAKKRLHALKAEKSAENFADLRLELGPFPIAMGRKPSAQARAYVARSGYALAVRGEVEVARALKIASLLGLPATKANVEGMAQMDVQVAGSWTEAGQETPSGFISPKVTGTVQLHNVRATVRGVNEPIQILSAELNLLAPEARVEKLDARFADARWTGTLDLPRGCGTPGACEIRFNLNTDDLSMKGLHAALGAKPKERRWYQVLQPSAPNAPAFLTRVRANGTVNAARLHIGDVVASHVSAIMDLDQGKLSMTNLRGEIFGGKHRGEWRVDFAAASPLYSGTGTLSGISLEKMAEAMRGNWISGTASGSYQLKSSGNDPAEFWRSAEGEIRFDARDGALSHVSLNSDDGPLTIGRWQGSARLNGGVVEVEKSQIESSGSVYEISGKASLAQTLDCELRDAGSKNGPTVYSITGTLAEPRVQVESPSETQARLKP